MSHPNGPETRRKLQAEEAEAAEKAARERTPSNLETFMRPVVEDEGLRPVVASVFIGLSTIIGWGLLLAVRDLHPAAMLSEMALVVLTVEVVLRSRREQGRVGIAGWALIALWLGASTFASIGWYTGFL
jgi:hypothetical protein